MVKTNISHQLWLVEARIWGGQDLAGQRLQRCKLISIVQNVNLFYLVIFRLRKTRWRRSSGRWTEPKHDSKAPQYSNSTPIPGLQVEDLFALELFSDDFLLNCCLPQINIVGTVWSPWIQICAKAFRFNRSSAVWFNYSWRRSYLSTIEQHSSLYFLPAPITQVFVAVIWKKFFPSSSSSKSVLATGKPSPFVRHNPLLPETCAISL